MLVIRLQRVGKKNQASFRVVLQEKTWSPKGKAKELLGFYNPVTKEKAFQKERINYWIQKGAQPSPTVHNMFVDEGLVTGKKVKSWQPKKKEKSAEPQAAAETPASDEDTVAEAEAKAPESVSDAQEKTEEPTPEPEAKDEKPAETPKEEALAEVEPAEPVVEEEQKTE